MKMVFPMATTDLLVSWSNHADEISTTFNDLMRQKELVDVTLVAEGHMFDAHRLVLSAISPYFRQIFTQMPVNQQAYVFFTDVSKQSLGDLLYYIYNGEVNVKQKNVNSFLRTAKALSVKGLNDDNHLNFVETQPTSFNAHLSRPFNATQYQSIGINKHKLPEHFGHQTNKTIPTKTNPLHCSTPIDSFSVNQFQNEKTYEFDHIMAVPVSNGNEPEESDYHDNIEPSYGDDHLGTQNYQLEDRKVFDGEKAALPAFKRAKRDKLNEFDDYDIVADIRTGADGRENLYYNGRKFCKHSKSSASILTRWVCTKNRSEKCRAIISTTVIGGVTKMKIVRDEHTH